MCIRDRFLPVRWRIGAPHCGQLGAGGSLRGSVAPPIARRSGKPGKAADAAPSAGAADVADDDHDHDGEGTKA